VKVEFASASMAKKVEARAQTPSAASAKSISTPVKAYEFQSSVEV
jgi:hypothetical protein